MEKEISPVESEIHSTQGSGVQNKPGRLVAVISIFALCIDALAVRSVSILAPFIRSGLHFDERQIGYVMAALIAGALVIGLPAGSIIGRVNIRFAFPIIMISVGLVFQWVAAQVTFYGLMLALFVLGLLRTGIIPLVNRVVIEHFTPSQRGRVLGLVYAAVPLGGFIGAVLLPTLAEFLDWNATFRIVGIISILGGFLIWAIAPKGGSNRSALVLKSGFSSLISRPFIILSVTYAFFCLSISAEAFFTLYLVDIVKISALLAGIFFGLIQLTGMGGRIFWGILADRYFRTNRWGLLVITNGLTVVSFGLLICLTPASPWWMIAGVMVLLGMSAASSWGVLSTLVGDVVGIGSIALATATIFFMTNFADVLGRILFGNLLKQTHSYQVTLGLYMSLGAITTLIFTWVALSGRAHRVLETR